MSRPMNADERLPPDIAQFVFEYFDSVAELEALLLVHATPTERWEARRLARRLYIAELEAEAVLHRLQRRGFVSREDAGVRYQPQAEGLQRQVEALSAAYPRFLIPITQLIHAKSRPGLLDFSGRLHRRHDE